MKYPSKILLLLIFGLLKNILLWGDLSCPYLKSSRDGRFLAGLTISGNTIEVLGTLGAHKPNKNIIDLPTYSACSHFAIAPNNQKTAYCLLYKACRPVRKGLIHIVEPFEYKITIESNHSGIITDLAWSTDGTILASCSSDGVIKLWKRTEWEETDKIPYELIDEISYELILEIQATDKQQINSISWSGRPYATKVLACGCKNGLIEIWQINETTSPCRCSKIRTLSTHKSESIRHIEFNPKTLGVILSVAADNSVRLFNTDSTNFFTILEPSDNKLLSALFSPCGKYIALQTKSQTQIWNYATKTIHKTYETPDIISVALIEDVINGKPSLILATKRLEDGAIDREIIDKKASPRAPKRYDSDELLKTAAKYRVEI
jgi:WD40 repeat protein